MGVAGALEPAAAGGAPEVELKPLQGVGNMRTNRPSKSIWRENDSEKDYEKAGNEEAAAKRELIAPRGDKRYIRRDAKGRIKESDDVSRSLSQDRRRKAKTKAKRRAGRPGRPQTRESAGTEKDECPALIATLDLFGEDALPEGMKYQAGFLSTRKKEPCCVTSSAFRSGSSSFTASPASAGPFRSAGAMISMAAD